MTQKVVTNDETVTGLKYFFSPIFDTFVLFQYQPTLYILPQISHRNSVAEEYVLWNGSATWYTIQLTLVQRF
jgi:hypothetical protein